MNSEEMDAED